MKALSESFYLTSIHNVFSWLISTFLRFSRIGKPILDRLELLKKNLYTVFNLIQRGQLGAHCSHVTRLHAAGIYVPVCNPIVVLNGQLLVGFEWEMGCKKIPGAQSPSTADMSWHWLIRTLVMYS